MKRNILYILAVVGMCFGAASCVPEELVNDTDVARHQITNLEAVAGDEEVTLSWSVPEGWEPTDYKITYSDNASVTQTILTGGAPTYTITGLVNDFNYTFSVQAIYGKAISNMVKKACKPITSRIAVATLGFTTADKEQAQQHIQLTWEKPSDLVLNYTLTYYPEMTPAQTVTKTLDKDATSYKIEGITNGDNYVISLVANYPKGAAPETKTTVYFKMAYITSATVGAIGQELDFSFNKEAYPGASDITWKFPDGSIKTGEAVSWTINTTGEKEVILSAKVGGNVITWPGIELNLRALILEAKDFKQNGTNYNGFKGSYPVFSPDGKTLYDITFNGFTLLYAYDLVTGTEKWRYEPAKADSYNPLTVNPVTGDIYFGTKTAGQFYCVGPDGKHKWTFTGAGSMQSTAPVVSADGSTVYIVDRVGKVFSINAATGAKNWGTTVGAGKIGGALLLNGNDLIVGIGDTAETVTFLNTADGSKIAGFNLSNGVTDIAGIAVSDDKKIAYIPLLGGGLASVDLEKRELIATNIFAGNNVYAPVVASNGFVVAGSKDGCVYALSADLSKVEWTFVHSGTPKNNVFNYSHMCANDQGQVFVTSGQDQNYVYVFNAATGAVISSERYGAHNAYKQMGGNNFNDGFLFSAFIGNGTTNGALIGQFFGGKRKFWGGPAGDICGSGCVQSPLL